MEYRSTKDFTNEQVKELFESVNWDSGNILVNYPQTKDLWVFCNR